MVSTVAASDDAEARFLARADLLSQSCAPDVSSGVDATHRPPWPAPRQRNRPPTPPCPSWSTRCLTSAEECAAQRHRLRVSGAFSGTDTITYEEMRSKLTRLNYPAARIHRMPDVAGEPVARLDLRVGAEHVALEVTDVDDGVLVEAFGAPEGVSVTEVRLESQPDAPTSSHGPDGGNL
ncbi:hypothetical protein [Streptomyces scabiei]|uniref:hypothetical protein n=1 Tax=Streptomyces scabiei TaxID=1930 RepID=UPI0029A3DB71|nr:hypothetical protein [Streptomyces scabiei]MDX3521505.1 hypothetical protein [Streptomyces scabiei]